MSEKLPKPIWSGTFRLMGVDLKCHVLDTGERVIESDSVKQFFELMEASDVDFDPAQVEAFARWRFGYDERVK